MATVVISAHNVVNTPDVGGHFWVYMQYAQALLQLGCEVYWLEHFRSTRDRVRDVAIVTAFLERMDRYGLGQKVILYARHVRVGGARYEFIGMRQPKADQVFRNADLLLNFNYAIEPELLSRFRRTALVDIDPGLLQFWISAGQLAVAEHDLYFTTGETVGKPAALFSDCGRSWEYIRPPVCVDLWPCTYDDGTEAFTTVSSWWCGDGKEFITDGKGIFYENNKRVSFLDFIELPTKIRQPLELALCLGQDDVKNTDRTAEQRPISSLPAAQGLDRHPYISDANDRAKLERYGWRVRLSAEVAGTPEMYQSYVRDSRGEFSCAKPSCMKLQNAWVSDRTLCYLATGKPVVIQDTGPSSYLPNGEGMFRFSNLEQAVEALATINADYKRHCQAAREIAVAHFDAKSIVEGLLTSALRFHPHTGNDKTSARPVEYDLSAPDTEKDATTQRMGETLQAGLSKSSDRPVRIAKLVRQFNEDSSTFTTERLRVWLNDGDFRNVFFKDLNPQNQIAAARLIRSPQLERGLREVLMYELVLSTERFGTPQLYASRWEPEQGIHWLFLEDTGSLWLNKIGDFTVWLEAARWIAEFHAAARTFPVAQIDFLPRHDHAYFWRCAQYFEKQLSRLDSRERPFLEKVLEYFVRATPRLLILPYSVIHGEYYGTNVAIREGSLDHPLAVIDWESAALGPSFFDLATLSAGSWTFDQKRLMWRCYFEEYQRASQQTLEWNSFEQALIDLSIYEALLSLDRWPDRNSLSRRGRSLADLQAMVSMSPALSQADGK
jgi:hypothetical protein